MVVLQYAVIVQRVVFGSVKKTNWIGRIIKNTIRAHSPYTTTSARAI